MFFVECVDFDQDGVIFGDPVGVFESSVMIFCDSVGAFGLRGC